VEADYPQRRILEPNENRRSMQYGFLMSVMFIAMSRLSSVPMIHVGRGEPDLRR
jgi:hypothetical protein